MILQTEGKYTDAPPHQRNSGLIARKVELHPITLAQNARTSGGGYVVGVPTQALTLAGGNVEGGESFNLAGW